MDSLNTPVKSNIRISNNKPRLHAICCAPIAELKKITISGSLLDQDDLNIGQVFIKPADTRQTLQLISN